MAAAAQTLEFTFTVVDKQILRNVIATARAWPAATNTTQPPDGTKDL